jgi:hypothetical protein
MVKITMESDGDEQDMTRYTVEVTQTVDVVASSEDAAKRQVGQEISHSAEKEILDSEALETPSPPYVTAKFRPQRWIDEMALTVEPDGKQTFNVPLSDALTADGELVDDYSRGSDALKRHDNAPLWVRNWDGPYAVTIEEVCLGGYETLSAACAACSE